MVFKLFQFYLYWFGISIVTFLIGCVISLAYSKHLAHDFTLSYVYYFNGFLIPTTGYGALVFAVKTYKGVYHNLIHNVLDIPDGAMPTVLASLAQLNSFRAKQKIAVPIFLMGAMLLFSCGYPLYGFPKFLLWLSTSSMYYAGGLMIAYLHHSVCLFNRLDNFHNEIKLQENTHILELENFNFYLSLLFLAGMIALYFAFRGTLTANFTFRPPSSIKLLVDIIDPSFNYFSIKKLLLYPLILFLPYALFGGFYIRYTLRKLYLNSIQIKLNEIDKLSEPFISTTNTSEDEINRILKIRSAVLDLKSKIIENNKILPLINIKDSPSIVLLVIIAVQFIYQNDQTIQDFVKSIFGIK